jgi:hypothetical protein
VDRNCVRIYSYWFFSKQPFPMWGFGVVLLTVSVGVYFMISAGHYTLNDESVTHQNAFGTYRMLWRDVRKIECGPGTIILHGEGSRFVLASPQLWSGRQKPDANTLLVRKIEASGIVPYPSNVAEFKCHKNVKLNAA